MFCINCGKEIGDGIKFCPQCGTPVGAAVGMDRGQGENAVPTQPGLGGTGDYEALRQMTEKAGKSKKMLNTIATVLMAAYGTRIADESALRIGGRNGCFIILADGSRGGSVYVYDSAYRAGGRFSVFAGQEGCPRGRVLKMYPG